MNAAGLARMLGGRKVGAGWLARCPAHDDREPSLAITDAEDGRVLVYCHAGCDQSYVIAALRARGLWEESGFRRVIRSVPRKSARSMAVERDSKRVEAAIAIWEAAMPASGTPVEEYLASRALHLPPSARLRFHSGLKHPSGGTWPVMVALVTNGPDDTPLAIHRTFLARDSTSKAPVEPSKMMLGPCRGGAVRLAPSSDVLMVGEGIETCFAAVQATNLPAWAALSTSGLRTLELPLDVDEVVLLADGDDAGKAAAYVAAARWTKEARRVRISHPPLGFDFNDLLLREAEVDPDEAAA